jgi:hypothetical protein
MCPTESNTNARARKSQCKFGNSLRPLRIALAHAAQLTLLLRRARREEIGRRRTVCLNRLLDTMGHVAASIESLEGSQSQIDLIGAGIAENLVLSGGLQ